MTKLRSEFIYQLVGIVKERKKTYQQRVGYKLIVNLPNQPEINCILAYQDKIANSQIWQDLEKLRFIDKKYLFYCQKHFANYHLINWRELSKDHGAE